MVDRAAAEEMLMIEPAFFSAMTAPKTLQGRTVPLRFSFVTSAKAPARTRRNQEAEC